MKTWREWFAFLICFVPGVFFAIALGYMVAVGQAKEFRGHPVLGVLVGVVILAEAFLVGRWLARRIGQEEDKG